MCADRLPSVFVSHGAPTLPMEDIPARHFLESLGKEIGKPEAILCVSAHWETSVPATSLAPQPETIYDFYGFPDALYELRYEAPGAPDLAERTAGLLQGAELDGDRGLDHGAWVPLLLMYPEADIPVTQLSVLSMAGPAASLEIGRALAPLRDEGVLILASGGAVHNLKEWRASQDAAPDWAQEFDDWLTAKVESGDTEQLLDYRQQGPHGARAHPTEEHFLPLFVAMGAGGAGKALHRSFAPGGLSMSAFAFGS